MNIKNQKSNADFPAYIQELKQLGITDYETFVAGGQTGYYGAYNYKATSPPNHEFLNGAETSSKKGFKADLKAHQNGHTDYPAFCNDSARSGIEKWAESMDEMTCAYFDKAGNKIQVVEIPY